MHDQSVILHLFQIVYITILHLNTRFPYQSNILRYPPWYTSHVVQACGHNLYPLAKNQLMVDGPTKAFDI